MSIVRFACPLIAGSLLVWACSSEPRPAAEPAQPSVAPVPPPAQPVAETPTSPAREPTAKELPVPEDFNAEVEQQITVSNYKRALDALEKELNTEP